MQQDQLVSFNQELDDIALEYRKLAALSELSEDQSQRLGEILEYAIDIPELDFRISEMDYKLGKTSGLLDEESCKSYKDQQALLREYLGCNISRLTLLSNDMSTCSTDLNFPLSSQSILQEELSYR